MAGTKVAEAVVADIVVVREAAIVVVQVEGVIEGVAAVIKDNYLKFKISNSRFRGSDVSNNWNLEFYYWDLENFSPENLSYSCW